MTESPAVRRMPLALCRALAAAALTLALSVSACASEPRVVLHTAGGDVPVTVEVAATPAEQSLGLMYRKQLGANAGMLFVFDANVEHPFWMKNTVLALDMLFLGEDRKIVGIVKDAVPFTTTSRTVGVPSRYVLEVNAGFSNKHGVKTGDRATFENVAAAP
ncbi:MAG: DUF192 domain-containing protein [Deltaproteobacteria bacterium]|nr:DUF192 domain-containing protein [Deltaproteobacteria bacterium]